MRRQFADELFECIFDHSAGLAPKGLRVIESRKARLKSKSKIGVMIINLSRAFDSLDHELLLANFKAYGLDNDLVTLMRS